MDGSRFDTMVRAFGEGRTRRGFVGLVAALAAGGAVGEAGAKRRCRSDSPVGQCCKKKNGAITCTCKNGGTVCGQNCCLLGTDCVDGQCLETPEPPTCIAFGEACKNVGRACCEGLACGSGQGGQGDVACYVPAGGACEATSECVFGSECKMGLCVANRVCNVQLGEICGPDDLCCAGTCGVVADLQLLIPAETRCCAGLGQTCSRDRDCCNALLNGTGKVRGALAIGCPRGVCEEIND